MSSHHISSQRFLFMIGGALLVLTALTVGVHYLHLPHPFSIIVALVIAFFKAGLVALFFMNLYWDDKFNLMLFFTALAFLALLLGLTMMDTMFRIPLTPSF